MKRALVLGITGQDGSYLAELLLEKGYEVHGMVRRSSTGNTWRIDHIKDKLTLHVGDLLDPVSVDAVLCNVYPDEVYNEADQDHVGTSFECPIYSYDITFKAVGTLLELAMRFVPEAKIFQPISATIFGNNSIPQNENRSLNPQSPYACAKAGAYHLCRYYRQKGLFVSTGILYNHDSPRRLEKYLVNKICRSAIRISEGKQDFLTLGDLDYGVDVGYAGEFVEAIYSVLQLDDPDDFVIGTGRLVSVRELAIAALDYVGIPSDRLKEDPTYQSNEGTLLADTTKLQRETGWTSHYYGERLVHKIIDGIRAL